MSTLYNFWPMLGCNFNANMCMEAFSSVSNIIKGDNPKFTLEDFKSVFPVFLIEEAEPIDDIEVLPVVPPQENVEKQIIPLAVFNLFYSMADASIKYKRFYSTWRYLMCLYIAHNLVLFLRTQAGDPGAQSALAGSMPFGAMASKSVEGLSISYSFMGMENNFDDYGTWKLTTYGQQLITLTNMYGHAGMWCNG